MAWANKFILLGREEGTERKFPTGAGSGLPYRLADISLKAAALELWHHYNPLFTYTAESVKEKPREINFLTRDHGEKHDARQRGDDE